MKKKLIPILMTAVLAVASLAGCSPATTAQEDNDAKASTYEAIAKEEIKIGEIESYYINDGGWCQAVHTSVVNSMKESGLKEDQLVTLECIGEDQASVESAFQSLIEEGCNVIIGGSTGYGSYLSDLADANPEVVILQSGYKEDNLVGFQIKNQEGWFLAGYASALIADSDQLGFAASMNEVSVRTAINAYALGAKYANENAKVQVVWANSWYDIDVETQDALTLINAGIKYMGMDASSPAIPQTCEANNAFVVGSNVDMHETAPNAVLFSAMWNFTPILNDAFAKISEGTLSLGEYYYVGGEASALSDFNAALVPQEIQEKVLKLREAINKNEVVIYSGELKDNKGNTLVEAGQTMPEKEIQEQNFFVDNVIGAQ